MNTPADHGLPASATALGYLGVLPFVAAVAGVALLDGAARDFATRALVAYGAVILSFLGAVHWGLMLRGETPGWQARTAVIAVMPSVAGAVALLLAPRHGLALLVAGFGGFWLYEHRVVGPGLLPPAYLALRRGLSLAVCSLLAVGLIALG